MFMDLCFFMMFFIGLLVFSSNRKHFLAMLLSLEFIFLSIFINLFMYLSLLSCDFFIMFFMVLSICEGALGLSILVMVIRTHGNDYFNSFNILW